MGREGKQGFSENLLKKKKKIADWPLKIPQSDKTSPVIQTKAKFALFCEINPTWIISCSCLWKPLRKSPMADMRQHLTNSLSFKKIPMVSIFCKSGFYGKLVSQSLSFIFLRAHT